jgi:hypothetical protein
MALKDYEIGSTSSTTNVEDLTTPLPPPRGLYNEYSAPTELASGKVRGGGWTEATWTFDFLTSAQLAQLRTFCTGKSATVYIRTLDDSETYPNYVYKTGVMVWPDGSLRKQNGKFLDVVIRFRALVTFTP